MSDEAGARVSRRLGLPPVWTSVLAVIAHPDEASFGLGAILDAFFLAGTRVEVLCLTHGQAWTLHGAPGDLAALRGAALASGADVLGPTREKMQDCRDGDLTEVPQTRLAVQVVAVADSCHPDGLLVFDAAELPGHLDHVAATSAALLAAETLDLPVLGWTFSESVAAQLNQESDASFTGPQHGNIDLRVTLDRARQRLASHANAGQALPGSAVWRRLELLADTGSLRWLHPAATQAQRSVDVEAIAVQQKHWAATFEANPDMYGTDPSAPGLAASEAFVAASHSSVLELGAGQGRDTLYLARQGLQVTALDYAPGTVETLSAKAEAAGLADLVKVARHDIRQPLPIPDASIDASYSHMLFSMALTTSELELLVGELRRVLRPGGLVVYTARTTADAHWGAGTPRGDDMYEHGGFIVHFFDRALIDRLATGFELIDVTSFTEGALPRRLARVTMRVPRP